MVKKYTDEERKLFYGVRRVLSGAMKDDTSDAFWCLSSGTREDLRRVRQYQRARREELLAQVARETDWSQRLPAISYPDFPKPHSAVAIQARRQVSEYISDFLIIANNPCSECRNPLLAVVHGQRRCICCDPLDQWLPYLPAIHEIVEPLLQEVPRG